MSVAPPGLDSDGKPGVAAGVVQQVAQHFLQVLLFAGKGQVGRQVLCLDDEPPSGMDPPHHPQQSGRDGRHPRALSGLAERRRGAGTGQVPVNLPVGDLHLLGHGLGQRARGGRGCRIAQHRQRRLEGVGQIAGLGAGTGQHGVVPFQHAVEILHQRLQFGGKTSVQPAAAAVAKRLQGTLQGLEGRQSDGHLRQRRQRQQQAQSGQRGRQNAAEAFRRTLRFAQVGGDHQAPSGVRLLGQHQSALDHPQHLPLRAGGFVPVQRPVGQGVSGQDQLGVPQRTCAQHARQAAAVGAQAVDLPVQAGIGLVPARVAQAGRVDARLPGGVQVEPGAELVHLAHQRRVQLAQHFVAEQAGEPDLRAGKRQRQRDHRGGQQPQTQRVGGDQPHGGATSR